MKAFKIVITLICIISMLSIGVSLEAKKKEKEAETHLFLDDSQLEKPEYYSQLSIQALQSFANALATPITPDINMIHDNMILANIDAKIAEEMVAVSLGMRQEYVKIEAQGKSLLSGNLEGSEAEISETLKAKLEDIKNDKAKFSEPQKAYFLNGFIYLASSIIREKNILESAKKFVDEAKNATGMAAAKYAKSLPQATAIVTDLPATLVSQMNTINEYITIAKTQGIEIPADVTKNLFK